VLDKYVRSTAREVATVLRVQASTTGLTMSYRSSLDEAEHQLVIVVDIPLRAWTHVALQVTALLAARRLTLIIVKKLNSLKHLVRTTAAESHN